MPALQILTIRSHATILKRLEEDLNAISLVLKGNEAGFDRPISHDLIDSINKLEQLSLQLSKTELIRAQQLLRYLFSMLEKHGESILSSNTTRIQRKQLLARIETSSHNIGTVPQLNAAVELPASQFLPKRIEKTKNDWKEISCPNPSRTARTIEQGKLAFLMRDRKCSVRSALRAEIQNKQFYVVENGNMQQYLNLMDKEYYKEGLFDADHLQPSTGLINRLKEMVEYMNLDPFFKKDMLSSRYNDDYFIVNSDGNVSGNYWLYASHYNAMQNLWFLLSSDNSGDKVAMDPLQWLKNNTLGKEYLTYLSTHGKSIDQSGIFYSIKPEGMSLRSSFTRWIERNDRQLIRFCQSFSQFHHEVRDNTKAGLQSKKRMRSHPEMTAILSTTTHSMFNKANDESSLSSADAELQPEIDEIAQKKLRSNPQYQDLLSQTTKMQRDAIRTAKTEVVGQNKKDDTTSRFGKG
jgi:hypothetical protein